MCCVCVCVHVIFALWKVLKITRHGSGPGHGLEVHVYNTCRHIIGIYIQA